MLDDGGEDLAEFFHGGAELKEDGGRVLVDMGGYVGSSGRQYSGPSWAVVQ